MKSYGISFFLIASGIITFFFLFSCKKDRGKVVDKDDDGFMIDSIVTLGSIETPFHNAFKNIEITLLKNSLSGRVPDGFLGLSFGTNMLLDPTYFTSANQELINIFSNLEPGVIRIGGNSVDRIFWSFRDRNNYSNHDSIYKDDISKFSLFAKAVRWKVIWGLNLGQSDSKTVTEEAKYVNALLKDELIGFEVGNEPEAYASYNYRPANYGYKDFFSDFKSYVALIKASIPSAKFVGPASNRALWTKAFAADAKGNCSLLSNHYYLMGPAGDPSVTMSKLLTLDPNLSEYLSILRTASDNIGVPYRFAEMNSCWKGGQDGISNVHASALWGVEVLLQMAKNGASGVNFHGGGNLIYSPIVTNSGDSEVKPLFYSMLMFTKAEIANFRDLKIEHNNSSVDAYYFNRKDGRQGVLIINKAANSNVVVIRNRNIFGNIEMHTLSGDKLDSYNSTRLDGSQVDEKGIWQPKSFFKQTVGSMRTKVEIKPTSATLLVFD